MCILPGVLGMFQSRSWNKKGAFLLRLSPHGGGFSIVESLFATFFAFFHNIKAFFAPFFHVETFLLCLSPYGGLFSPFKSLSATFFSMWGLFCYVFSPYGGLFSLFEGPFGEPFSPFKGPYLLLFFLYVEAFLLRFSCGGAFFHLLKAFLLLFFSMWGCCICFYGDLF